MPDVREGEDRSSYMARCVPQVMKEGLDQKAAVGKCEGMYDSHVKKSASAVRKAIGARDSLVGATPAQRQFEYERVYKEEMAESSSRVEKSQSDDAFFKAKIEGATGTVDKAYEEGHVSHRKAGDFRKTGGEWIRVKGPGQGAAPSAAGSPDNPTRMRTTTGGPAGDDLPGSESLTPANLACSTNRRRETRQTEMIRLLIMTWMITMRGLHFIRPCVIILSFSNSSLMSMTLRKGLRRMRPIS